MLIPLLLVSHDVTAKGIYHKGWIDFNKNETQKVTFKLTPQDLGMWRNPDGKEKFEVEPGTFTLMIGSSSEDIRLKNKLLVR